MTTQTIHPESRPIVWAVVLNWNGLDDTSRCICSLEKTGYPSLRIVVVDNASTDGSADALQAKFPLIPLLRHAANDGYSAGNNVGIRYALGHDAAYVLVINNDVVVEPGFLAPMLETIARDPAIGMVTCKAYLQPGSEALYPTAGTMNYVRCAGVGLSPEAAQTEREVTFISGCIFLCKREVFDTIGLLDEKFFMYFEDLEFSRRVMKKYTLLFTPRGVVYHRSGGGQGMQNYSPLYLYHMTRNRFWAFQDDPAPYRAYVIVYSLLLAVVKSAMLAYHAVRSRAWLPAQARLRAIWNGYVDGLRRPGAQKAGRRY